GSVRSSARLGSQSSGTSPTPSRFNSSSWLRSRSVRRRGSTSLASRRSSSERSASRISRLAVASGPTALPPLQRSPLFGTKNILCSAQRQFSDRDRNQLRKRSARVGRKRPAGGGAGEVGFGEAKGPGRLYPETGIRRRAKEIDGLVGSVFLIGGGDEGGDRRGVVDQLGFTLDHDRLVGIVRADGATGSTGKVARFARPAARAEPERVVDPDTPDRHDVWPRVGSDGR